MTTNSKDREAAVVAARATVDKAIAERDRFSASIEALGKRIAEAADVESAMPLHTELETRRLFLARAIQNLGSAEAALDAALREADAGRLADLAKAADPATWRGNIAALWAKAFTAEKAWREGLTAMYSALHEQRAMAAEAGSEALPLGYCDALAAFERFGSHVPDMRIPVPPTRGALISAVLAYCDALHVATDTAFRSVTPDDELLAYALDGTLRARHTAFTEERSQRHAQGRAAFEARGTRRSQAHAALLADPRNETKRAEYEAAHAEWQAIPQT